MNTLVSLLACPSHDGSVRSSVDDATDWFEAVLSEPAAAATLPLPASASAHAVQILPRLREQVPGQPLHVRLVLDRRDAVARRADGDQPAAPAGIRKVA